jgi:hypothetical protein
MDILSALKGEASKLQQQLDGLNSAIKALGGGNSVGRGNGRKRKRHFSAASKAKMAASQKARWAKIKAAKKNT